MWMADGVVHLDTDRKQKILTFNAFNWRLMDLLLLFISLRLALFEQISFILDGGWLRATEQDRTAVFCSKCQFYCHSNRA